MTVNKKMPKLTIGINTAQFDYPLTAYPDIHLFEWTMRHIRKQTFKDFEVVIADTLYYERSDYFEKHPEDFPVIHVPVKPNIWLPNNACAICTTKNTFLIHAKGNIIISVGDCIGFDEDFFARTIKHLEDRKGFGVASKYTLNEGDKILVKDERDKHIVPSHKYCVDIHGNVAMYARDWEKLNGYDEMYDGSKGLEDIDLGIRMRKARIRVKLIDPPIIYQHHITSKASTAKHIKCSHLWWHLAVKRIQKEWVTANTAPLTEEEYKFLQSCQYTHRPEPCPVYEEKCLFGDYFPEVMNNSNPNLIKLYKHPSLIFLLKVQRRDPISTVENLRMMCNNDKIREFLNK